MKRLFLQLFLLSIFITGCSSNNSNTKSNNHTTSTNIQCTIPKECGGKTITTTSQKCSSITCCPVGETYTLYDSKDKCIIAQRKYYFLLAYAYTNDIEKAMTIVQIAHPELFPEGYIYSESGHDAGYQWAEDNDIDSIYYCDGNSQSFNEGCENYVCDMADYYPDDYECY